MFVKIIIYINQIYYKITTINQLINTTLEIANDTPTVETSAISEDLMSAVQKVSLFPISSRLQALSSPTTVDHSTYSPEAAKNLLQFYKYLPIVTKPLFFRTALEQASQNAQDAGRRSYKYWRPIRVSIFMRFE